MALQHGVKLPPIEGDKVPKRQKKALPHKISDEHTMIRLKPSRGAVKPRNEQLVGRHAYDDIVVDIYRLDPIDEASHSHKSADTKQPQIYSYLSQRRNKERDARILGRSRSVENSLKSDKGNSNNAKQEKNPGSRPDKHTNIQYVDGDKYHGSVKIHSLQIGADEDASHLAAVSQIMRAPQSGEDVFEWLQRNRKAKRNPGVSKEIVKILSKFGYLENL